MTRSLENSTRLTPAQLVERGQLPTERGSGDTMPKNLLSSLRPIPAERRRRALDVLVRPTRAEIDLDRLRGNLAVVRKAAGQAGVLAVVKANGYGHGAVPVARALEADVAMLGVALVEEGVELRNAGVRAPILVLGGSYEGGYELLVEHELVPAIFRPEHLLGLERAAKAKGRIVLAHLKVDSGMGRIGVRPEVLDSFLARARRCRRVRLDGVLSHLATADTQDAPLTRQQVSIFEGAYEAMLAKGFSPSFRHLSNSAGLLGLGKQRPGITNLVRPGILLYGLSPAAWLDPKAPVRPVLSWKTGITHLKRVPAGTPVSYGSTWIAKRPSLIATLPVGYADGYGREYSSRAQVLVRGKRAPVAGRVSMDMTMIDVTSVRGVEVGDEVVLLGSQGREEITAEELAAISGTLHYEVLCAIGARVPRVVRPPRGP